MPKRRFPESELLRGISCLGTSATAYASVAANQTDLEAGIRELPRLFSLLPRLCAVVLVGRKAQQACDAIKHLVPKVTVFQCPHPSPQFVNTDPANRQRILDVLDQVADFEISCRNA